MVILMVTTHGRQFVVAVSAWTNPIFTPAEHSAGTCPSETGLRGIPLEVGPFLVSDTREATEHNIIALPKETHVDIIRA